MEGHRNERLGRHHQRQTVRQFVLRQWNGPLDRILERHAGCVHPSPPQFLEGRGDTICRNEFHLELRCPSKDGPDGLFGEGAFRSQICPSLCHVRHPSGALRRLSVMDRARSSGRFRRTRRPPDAGTTLTQLRCTAAGAGPPTNPDHTASSATSFGARSGCRAPGGERRDLTTSRSSLLFSAGTSTSDLHFQRTARPARLSNRDPSGAGRPLTTLSPARIVMRYSVISDSDHNRGPGRLAKMTTLSGSVEALENEE